MTGFEWTYDSPDLLQLLRDEGYDVDRLLSQARRDIDWLLETADITMETVLDGSDVTSAQLLAAARHDTDWLLFHLQEDRDWLISEAGENIGWLLDKTNAKADQLLAWAGQDADWLLGELGEDVDWVLTRSGHDISWMIGAADKTTDWVEDKVKDIFCGNLKGYARDVCNLGIGEIADSLSKLLDKADKDADWWLDEAGKDVDWLLGEVGEDADWLLDEANRDKTWLMGRLQKDADWLVARANKTTEWLLEELEQDADWVLDRAGKTRGWLFERFEHDTDWMIREIGRDADWILARAGWSMEEGELRYSLLLQAQVVTSRGFTLDYDAIAQVANAPSAIQPLTYLRRIGVGSGRLNAADGLGATGAAVTLTYSDPSGISVSGGGDAGMFNQDVAIVLREDRGLYDATRHADDWLLTLCIPVKEIITALLSEIPPAAAAVLILVPDVMMTLDGDAGFWLENEVVNPQPGRTDTFTLPQRRRAISFPVTWTADAYKDARLNGGSYGFAWGLMCGPGINLMVSYDIPGGETLKTAGPATIGTETIVEIELPLSLDTGQPPGTQPLPRPGPKPVPDQPIRPDQPTQQMPATPTIRPPVSAAVPANGDFSSGLGGWRPFSSAGQRPGNYFVDVQGGAAVFRRTQSNSSGGDAGIDQQLSLAVTDPTYLEMQVMVVHQTLQGGGFRGGEYPLQVVVRYEDQQGQTRTWRHGFYYLGRSVEPTMSTRMQPNQWAPYRSPNLARLSPAPQTITAIRLYANGWDYEGRVDNVRFSQ